MHWTLAALMVTLVATAGLFVFIGHRQVGSNSRPGSTPSASSASASAAPVTGAVADAAAQYLAAVAPVNADGDRFHAALAADAALPCSCSPGEFAVRADALAEIPSLNRDTEALQVVLQRIKNEVPDIAVDVDAVVADNQQYMYYLAAAYRAAQDGGVGVGDDIASATTLHSASAPNFVRLRHDLGLPPPPTG